VPHCAAARVLFPSHFLPLVYACVRAWVRATSCCAPLAHLIRVLVCCYLSSMRSLLSPAGYVPRLVIGCGRTATRAALFTFRPHTPGCRINKRAVSLDNYSGLRSDSCTHYCGAQRITQFLCGLFCSSPGFVRCWHAFHPFRTAARTFIFACATSMSPHNATVAYATPFYRTPNTRVATRLRGYAGVAGLPSIHLRRYVLPRGTQASHKFTGTYAHAGFTT